MRRHTSLTSASLIPDFRTMIMFYSPVWLRFALLATFCLVGYVLPCWLRFAFLATLCLLGYALPSWLRFAFLATLCLLGYALLLQALHMRGPRYGHRTPPVGGHSFRPLETETPRAGWPPAFILCLAPRAVRPPVAPLRSAH